MKAFALLLALSLGAHAADSLTLAGIFTDNMVLQREKPVQVWGKAAAGERISVAFAGQTKSATAAADGSWRATLDPLVASNVPSEMTVTGSNAITLKNILVGEVWLCSGQSNMEKPIGEKSGQKPTLNAEEEIRAATFPEIRLLKVKRARVPTPATEVGATWTVCGPDTIDQIKFSAAGYFFGRKIHQELKVPVGLIDSTWGGTRIEPWTSPEGFVSVPSLAAFAAAARTRGAKVEGTDVSTLFNGMIAPLAPFTLRGAIWYQGESNVIDADDGIRYADKMTALIRGWRTVWHDEFPFYYVQIAPHLYHVVRSQSVVSPEAAPRVWEAQTAAMQLPRTGMIVTTDLVDDLLDIHPRDKRSVGERLALWALAKDYGRSEVVFSGPIFKGMEVQGDRALASFDHVGGGLVSKDDKPLSWFVIAGADGVFFPATATIEGERVAVTSPRVAKPVTVRFAWDEAARPNFCNQAGLPAVPFRTDAERWSVPPETAR